MPTVDWTNPCARAAALRAAYYEVLSGGNVTLIKESANGGEREVRFGKADIQRLSNELQRAEDECAAATGLPARPRRYAIRLGSRKRPSGPFGV